VPPQTNMGSAHRACPRQASIFWRWRDPSCAIRTRHSLHRPPDARARLALRRCFWVDTCGHHRGLVPAGDSCGASGVEPDLCRFETDKPGCLRASAIVGFLLIMIHFAIAELSAARKRGGGRVGSLGAAGTAYPQGAGRWYSERDVDNRVCHVIRFGLGGNL